jgi:hypothetical protein
VKTASVSMLSHLQQEVTTLASCWKVKRTDGVVFRFTDHDADIRVDIGDGLGVQTYEAESSYSRTAVKSDDSLAVDNLDLQGVLDSDHIDETELRRGLFNFAEISVFLVNWADTSMGIIKMRQGWIGEVTVTPNGVFYTELRGLTQAFARKLGETYSPECRADLGDTRCKLPVDPTPVARSTAYTVGQFVKQATALEAQGPRLLAPYDTNGNDTTSHAAVGTLGGQAVVQTVVKKYGAGAVEFTPTASRTPSASFVSYPDQTFYTTAAHPFCIEGWVRFKDLTDTDQCIAAHWNATGNQRSWALSRNGANLRFEYSLNGTAVVTVDKAATWATNTWYHVAVVRKGGTLYLFQDGVLLGSDAGAIGSGSIFDSTEVLRVGKKLIAAGDSVLTGFVDDFSLTIGWWKYNVAGFTPPAAAINNADYVFATILAGLPYTAFGDLIWQCTTAGTTSSDAVHYGSSPTTDGSAVFTSQQAWSKFVQVVTVDGAAPRKKFNVGELTPSSGGATPGRDEFPDDCMNGGLLKWATGPNAGRAMEVRDFTAAGQLLELYLSMPFDIEVGDTAVVYRGCGKRRDEDCLAVFNNVINFRGEPDVPGTDQMMSIPSARST